MDDKSLIQEAFVTLAAENLNALIEFYQALLDLEPYPYVPEHYAEFALPGLKLALFKPNANHNEEFIGSAASMSLCLEVRDLDVAIATLAHLGHTPPCPIIHASHGQEIYAYDPAGNRLILHQSTDLPQSTDQPSTELKPQN
ncbi:MAG: glyoxalase [Cyanobacteria bacterium P01_F01_bin.116]